MKPLVQLNPADFEKVAVWRYQGETDATAVVRATDRIELSESEHGIFIARTQFVLANGAQFVGFCTPTDDTELQYLQPVIVTQSGLVYFWFQQPPTQEFLREQWKRLGVGHEEIFPVHFRCTVPVGGHYVTGTIRADDLTGAA